METHYRITSEPHPEQSCLRLLLDGRFGEDALSDLRASICQARGAYRLIYIDLSEVTLVDRKAVQFFSETAGADVKLVNCPVYLRRWISQASDETEI